MSTRLFARATFWGAGLAAVMAAAVAAQPAPPATGQPQPLAPAPRATPLPPPGQGAYGPPQQGQGPYGPPQQGQGPYGPPPGQGAYGPPPPGAYGPNAGDPRQAYRDAYLGDYFAYLRNTLRITPAQQGLWMRFEETVRANMQDRQAAQPAPRDPRAGPAPLPDRFAQRRQRLDSERARLDATEGALRPLYAALSEEQRRIADNVLRPGQVFGGPARRFTVRGPFRARRPFGRL